MRVTLTTTPIGDKAEVLTLNHEGEGALDKRGTLYVLAIGMVEGLGGKGGIAQRREITTKSLAPT